jgi:hypothetical protein
MNVFVGIVVALVAIGGMSGIIIAAIFILTPCVFFRTIFYIKSPFFQSESMEMGWGKMSLLRTCSAPNSTHHLKYWTGWMKTEFGVRTSNFYF